MGKKFPALAQYAEGKRIYFVPPKNFEYLNCRACFDTYREMKSRRWDGVRMQMILLSHARLFSLSGLNIGQ